MSKKILLPVVKLFPVFEVVRLSDYEAMLLASETARPGSKADNYILEKIFIRRSFLEKKRQERAVDEVGGTAFITGKQELLTS
jgi:hypothetical protein